MAGGVVSEAGPLGEEAVRLLEAAVGWLRERSASETGGHDPITCRICPLCRLLAVARSAQPETFEHLLAAAESIAAAARTLGEPRRTPPSGGVQHIDIG